MLDLDFLSTDHSNYDSFYKCYLDDQFLIGELQGSISEMNSQNESFSFFNIGLSDQEFDIFSHFEISDVDIALLTSDIHEIYNHSLGLFNSLNCSDAENQYLLVQEAANIVSKLTSVVLSVSGYDSALVMLTIFPKEYAEEIYIHRDKSYQERLSMDGISPIEDRYFYLFTLKGDRTLYFPFDSQETEIFENYVQENRNGVGHYIPVSSPELVGAINISNHLSPNFGYGSIHLAGGNYGAIHAAPLSNDGRIILVICPEKLELLEAVENLSTSSIKV